MAENFLTKPIGGLPTWGWGLAAVGGIGIALYIRSRKQQSIPGGSAASDVGTGNVLPDQYATTAGQISPGTPFPTVPGIGGSPVPVFPGSGWTPILDGQGNVIGWNPPGPPGTNGTAGAPVPIQPGPPQANPPTPGQIFKGPTGVTHYVATGQQTIMQIAAALHRPTDPSVWNSVEKLNGGVSPTWKPPLGYVLTI